MNYLLNQLEGLKKICLKKNWIDTHISVQNLLTDLGDKDLSELEKGGPSPLDLYGTVFPPYIDPALEDRVASLPLKFEFERKDHVPTLYIHSREFIEEEVFDNIYSEVEDLVKGSASMELINPYMIVETHSYCLNLDTHMRELYAVVSKHIYGTYHGYDSSISDGR